MSIYNNFSEKDFEYWIFQMDDKLVSFISSLYGDIKTHLDYSIESLKNVEEWLINTYKTPEAIDAMHRAITVDGFCRYIGEVFRKKIGGHWDMLFQNESVIEAGPFLTGFQTNERRIHPYELMKKALQEKSGNFLKSQLQSISEK